MSFIQEKTIHRWGSKVPYRTGALFQKDFGKSEYIESIRKGNAETGHDWLGGQGFSYKANRSYFLG